MNMAWSRHSDRAPPKLGRYAMAKPFFVSHHSKSSVKIYGGEGREAARRRFRSRTSDEFRRITLVSIDAKPRTSIDRGLPKSIDVLSWTSLDNTYGINRILKSREDHDSRGVRSKTPTSAQPYLRKLRSTF
ncbi:hypothetical protein F2Q68_00005057 [Brassica cretica]|uniref:Uncharacterized protein n=1 Tax=Brassica cretica TaxID=69181 RepID=A0A8S9JLB8_BRACR|nr:hypothetical protein F2Q68_00005057 [Brassica cretica]